MYSETNCLPSSKFSGWSLIELHTSYCYSILFNLLVLCSFIFINTFSFTYYLADSRCIWDCLWVVWTILAIHSSLYSCCNRPYANNNDWSLWVEVKTGCSHFHNTTPLVYYIVQWVLQDPFPSYILPLLYPGRFWFMHFLFDQWIRMRGIY